MRRRTGRDSTVARTNCNCRRARSRHKGVFRNRHAVEGLESRVLLSAMPTSELRSRKDDALPSLAAAAISPKGRFSTPQLLTRAALRDRGLTPGKLKKPMSESPSKPFRRTARDSATQMIETNKP